MAKIEIFPKRRRDNVLMLVKKGYKEDIGKFIYRITGEHYPVNKHHTNDEYDAYLKDWVKGKVTLSEWISYGKTNLLADLKRFNLTKSDLQYVKIRQYRLYQRLRDELLWSFKNELLEISLKPKQKAYAKKQFELLEKLDHREIDKNTRDEISTGFGVHNFKLTYVKIPK